MNLCILDAAPYRHPAAAAVRRALTEFCGNRGATPRTFYLPDIRIADCVGDFKCWTHTPGECAISDANREIARAMIESDVIVFLTPVTFGGYASELKKAVDHLIPNISPFFAPVAGETHHEKRYERYPALVGIGIAEREDADAARVFRAIVRRNAINMSSERVAGVVIAPGTAADRIIAEIGRVLEAATGTGQGDVSGEPDVADAAARDGAVIDFGPDAGVAAAPRTALVLAGSPRGERSSSTAVSAYLREQLAARGVEAEMAQVYRARRSPEGTDALAAAIDRADLVVLACPLYVDSLPTGVIALLEHVAARRRASDAGAAGGAGAPPTQSTRHTGPPRFAAFVQCGFPEARHNHTALAVCRQFARESGFTWAGGLPLGGGDGLIQRKPLASLGGRAAFLRQALDRTAAALAAGERVPDEAVRLIARPFVPAWLYRLIGNVGWRLVARRRRTPRPLRSRPYGARP